MASDFERKEASKGVEQIMGKLVCQNCKYEFDRDIKGPVDVVVCPNCKQKVEIHQVNTTMPGQNMLYIKILKEGKKKYESKDNNATQYL